MLGRTCILDQFQVFLDVLSGKPPLIQYVHTQQELRNSKHSLTAQESQYFIGSFRSMPEDGQTED